MAKKPSTHTTQRKGPARRPVQGKPAELQPHPIADLFPMMNAEQLEALAADIKANGQRVPIDVQDGLIIDGRNRYRACVLAGVKPVLREWKGESIAHYVASMNMQRRNLTDSQRACAAVKLLPMLEAEAMRRSVANLKQNGGSKAGQAVGRSRDIAASIFGVSGAYIQQAKRLAAVSSEAFDACFHGGMAISRALRQHDPRSIAKPRKEQPTVTVSIRDLVTLEYRKISLTKYCLDDVVEVLRNAFGPDKEQG